MPSDLQSAAAKINLPRFTEESDELSFQSFMLSFQAALGKLGLADSYDEQTLDKEGNEVCYWMLMSALGGAAQAEGQLVEQRDVYALVGVLNGRLDSSRTRNKFAVVKASSAGSADAADTKRMSARTRRRVLLRRH